jgi:VRR-NUC domain
MTDRNAEARLQAAIVEYVRAVAPDVLVFHVPNGGLRTPAEAARMRWQGVVAGVPDLCLIAPGGRAFFLEVKTERGSLSSAQRDVHGWLTALGTGPAVVRSIDDVHRAFQAWQIPTKEASP